MGVNMPQYKTAEELHAMMGRMVDIIRAAQDKMPAGGSVGPGVGFTISDLGTDFGLTTLGGRLTYAPGAAASCPIGVTLTSANLDRLLSGQLDPESAYMSGVLSLRGDEWVAQSAADGLPALVAAYKAATVA